MPSYVLRLCEHISAVFVMILIIVLSHLCLFRAVEKANSWS